MQYEVDQSGKVEQTNVDTIIAFAGNLKYAAKLNSKDKKRLLEIFKTIHKTRLFPYHVFSAVLAYSIVDINPKGRIVIDNEYTGYDNLIRKRVYEFLVLLNYKHEVSIDFGHVGKSSCAHEIAYKVANGKRKAERIVSFEDIIYLVIRLKKDRELLKKSHRIA